MRSVKKTLLKGSACLPLIALALSGCATVDSGPAIKAGDTVGVHFTCRLPNAAIAISSEKDVAADPLLPKAPFFLPRVTDETLELVAGVGEAVPPKFVKGFENDVLKGIADGLTGMRVGESRTLELGSSASDNKELRLARVHHAAKEKQVSLEEFKTHTHKEPVKGQTIQYGEGLPGVVKEISDGKVTIAFSAPDGTTVHTRLGPGTVRDAGKQYDIVIDARQGDLVRMGPLVGRVKFVDERNFDLDFSKTFGGENLRCDVKVETVKPGAEPGTAATAATPVTAEAQGNAGRTQPQKTDAPSPGTQQGEALLQKAITESVKEGKTSVSMDMDTLLQVAKGDLATVLFTIENPDGSPLLLPEGSAKPGAPQEVIAGNEEVFPGLGDAVIGMAAGEKKQITLPPEKAYGPRDESKTANIPLKNSTPNTITLPADEYVKRFGGFPAQGREVPLYPYVTTKVTKIGEKDVTLANTAQDGARFSEPFGTVTVAVGKDCITLQLDPKVGAPFNTGDRQGVITSSSGDTFTVDFNHPLAGKTIVLKLEVVAVTKAAELKATPIHWIENHDDGLAVAKKEGKPLFLLLYADWCHWCQKTQSDTLTDPRIERLKDKFVWMRLNSDKEKKYKQEFGQDGFPMMVILRPDGTVMKKIDGYRNAAALKAELDGVL
jgi:FKBP-type peptidyl-prolyl cis-trans isomerase 2